ncbi:hypothetical protein [Streptomyces sp. B6B3]|uniref:type II toxin-antitoxin system Phd/YefM family antitoxin n=1 Tax=Streptomyces sp. B6B3 TaxID=3153570 RepID=UPI00325CD345
MRTTKRSRETDYLLRSPANARHLLESIAEAESGAVERHELVDDGEGEDGERGTPAACHYE